MILNACNVRYRLSILARIQTPDADNGITYTETVLTTVWGNIVPKKGSVYLYGEQIGSSEDTHEIQLRYINYLTTENWVRHTQQVFKTNQSQTNDVLLVSVLYRIREVKNLWQRDRYLILSCQEYKET